MNSSAAANIHYSSLADRYRAAREYVCARIGRYYITGGRSRGMEKGRTAGHAAPLRGIAWAKPRSIARGNGEDQAWLHLSIRAEQMARFNANCAADENHASAKQKLPPTSFAPRGEVSPPGPPSLRRPFSSIMTRTSICEAVSIKLIARHVNATGDEKYPNREDVNPSESSGYRTIYRGPGSRRYQKQNREERRVSLSVLHLHSAVINSRGIRLTRSRGCEGSWIRYPSSFTDVVIHRH